jgi:hypothetical protein
MDENQWGVTVKESRKSDQKSRNEDEPEAISSSEDMCTECEELCAKIEKKCKDCSKRLHELCTVCACVCEVNEAILVARNLLKRQEN